MYDLPERPEPTIPNLASDAPRESPWAAVALGATLQGVGHLLYLGSLVLGLLLFLASLSPTAGPPETGVVVISIVAVFAFALNFLFALLAGAVLASADAGGRARGLGLGILACTALVLLSGPNLAFEFQLMDMGPVGGGAMGKFSTGAVFLGMLFLGLCEMARLALVGFYVSVAASAARKRGLSSSGQFLGVLTPIVQIVLGLISFTLVTVLREPGEAGKTTGTVVVLLNGAAHALLILFGAVLCFQLRGVASDLAEARERD